MASNRTAVRFRYAKNLPGFQNLMKYDSRLSLLLVVASLVSLLFQEFHWINFTLDDPFISFRYAENLVKGYGLVFNPGERVEGYSNFLWTVLLALPVFFGVSRFDFGLLLTAKALGVALSLATLVLLWHTARVYRFTFSPSSKSITWIAPILLASSGFFAFWSVGGLETPLLSLLILLSIYFYLRDDIDPVSRLRLPLSSICLALASLTRPEPVVLFGVAMLFRVVDRMTRRVFRWRHELLWIAGFVSIYGIFLLWRLYYYGSLVPNTFYAKIGGISGGFENYVKGFEYIRSYVLSSRIWIILLIAFLPLAFTRHLKRHYLFTSLMLSAYTAAIIYTGGDWMPGFRFMVPALPLLALMFQDGANVIWAGVLRVTQDPLSSFRKSYLAGVISSLLLLLLLANTWLAAAQTTAVQVPWLVSGFVAWPLLPRDYYSVGKFMGDNLSSNDLVAIGEAGIIPYYSKARVLDMFGLMDRHIAHLKGALHTKFDVGYVLSREPDYVLLAAVTKTADGKLTSPYVYANALWSDKNFQVDYEPIRWYPGHFLLYKRHKGFMDHDRNEEQATSAFDTTQNIQLLSSEKAKTATITSSPNPIPVCDGSGLGVTTLSYTVPEGVEVEVHVGSPDGPLFAREGASGTSTTGKWVTGGMVFFLQDVSGGKPLTGEHTLARVTININTTGCP